MGEHAETVAVVAVEEHVMVAGAVLTPRDARALADRINHEASRADAIIIKAKREAELVAAQGVWADMAPTENPLFRDGGDGWLYEWRSRSMLNSNVGPRRARPSGRYIVNGGRVVHKTSPAERVGRCVRCGTGHWLFGQVDVNPPADVPDCKPRRRK